MKKFTPLNGQLRRLALALTGCFGLALGAAHAQAPANDDPCGAVTLTAQGGLCTAPATSTNQNATTTVPNGYANAGAPRDVWFAFTTAATGPASFGATLTVSGNPAGLVELMAASSCTGPLAVVAASSSGQSNTVAPRLTTGALRPGTRYYVRVAGYAPADPTGPFTICLTDGPGQPTCAPPALGTPTYGSPTTATLPYTPGINNTAPVTVTVSGPNGFSQTTTSAASPIQLTGLTQGTAYTVAVTATCAASGQTAPVATATLQTPTRYCSTNLGGSCGSAAITAVEIVGTTLTNGNQSPYCNAGAYVNFAVAAPTTATLNPGTPYQLSVKTATSATQTGDDVAAWLDFNQNGVFEAAENIMPRGPATSSNARVVTFQVPLGSPAGPTGLRVRGVQAGTTTLGPGSACATVIAGGETEDYTVSIGATATCAAPTGLSVSNLTPYSATLNFTPVPGAAGYTIIYSLFPGGGGPGARTLFVTAPPAQLTGISPNSLLYATVVTNCGPGLVSGPARTAAMQVPSAPPLNDDCLDAALLSTGTNPVPVRGGTNFGSITAPAPAPSATCNVPVNQDVWYRFVATLPAHNVVVSADERSSILVDVFAGTCNGGFSRLGCVSLVANPNGNQIVVLSVPLTGLTPGSTYYVRIGQQVTTVYALPFAISIENPGAGYCITGLGGSATCAGVGLGTTAITRTSLNSVSAQCSGSYTEYPAFGSYTGTVARGEAYQLQTTVQNGPADVSFWIDFNQNYLFEPSEYVAVAANAPTGTVAATFTVPATAALGSTRLRVRARAAGVGNGPTDACTDFSPSGETEDYTLTIALTTATRQSVLAAQVGLFPNPATGSFTLRLPAALSRPAATATLCNALGQVVLTQPLASRTDGSDTRFDVRGLAPGVYVLRLPTPAGVVAKRVVLE